jgi:secondary thiamine-phosphate synthase enzyme
MIEQQTITLQTEGRSIIDITGQVEELLRVSGIEQGLCHVFLHHTSASLIITENADSNVRRDLENYIATWKTILPGWC